MTEEVPKKLNYPSNSSYKKDSPTDAPAEGRKKVEKVISGDAIQRKKPLGRKIAETFTGDDVRSVGLYVLFDVVIPAAKTMIADAASQGVERMLFGDSGGRRISPKGPAANKTSYNRMYTGSTRSDLDRPAAGRNMSYRARAAHDFDEVVLGTRVEAEEVLDRLGDLIDNYDVATVSDLYDLVGITGSFTDDKWGWTDLRGATTLRVSDGYLLNLPKTKPID